MLTYSKDSVKVTKISAEEKLKQERMRDIVLLLGQLVEREEIALKLIIDCLYDVGSVNLVNKKIRNRSLNRFLKAIAKFPKPILRIIALRWLKKNLPTLLADWLEEKASFK